MRFFLVFLLILVTFCSCPCCLSILSLNKQDITELLQNRNKLKDLGEEIEFYHNHISELKSRKSILEQEVNSLGQRRDNYDGINPIWTGFPFKKEKMLSYTTSTQCATGVLSEEAHKANIKNQDDVNQITLKA